MSLMPSANRPDEELASLQVGVSSKAKPVNPSRPHSWALRKGLLSSPNSDLTGVRVHIFCRRAGVLDDVQQGSSRHGNHPEETQQGSTADSSEGSARPSVHIRGLYLVDAPAFQTLPAATSRVEPTPVQIEIRLRWHKYMRAFAFPQSWLFHHHRLWQLLQCSLYRLYGPRPALRVDVDICIASIAMDWTASSSTGKKRPPNTDGDNDFIAEQPLSKKLASLSLRAGEKLQNHRGQEPSSRKKQTPVPSDERMEVDNDNSNVVYIYDLDDELDSDDDDDDGRRGLIFVPDIEKRLTRIPYALAKGDGGGGSASRPSSGESTALVLYTVPSSLTVSREQDNVRRAIIEARARIRQKQVDHSRQQGLVGAGGVVVDTVDGAGLGLDEEEDDPDAMDIE